MSHTELGENAERIEEKGKLEVLKVKGQRHEANQRIRVPSL